VPVYKKEHALWNQVAKENPDQPDKYIITGYKEVVMETVVTYVFPPHAPANGRYVKAYKEWSNFKGKRVVIDRCGVRKQS
jgi:hypothetical protein